MNVQALIEVGYCDSNVKINEETWEFDLFIDLYNTPCLWIDVCIKKSARHRRGVLNKLNESTTQATAQDVYVISY